VHSSQSVKVKVWVSLQTCGCHSTCSDITPHRHVREFQHDLHSATASISACYTFVEVYTYKQGNIICVYAQGFSMY